MSNPWFRMYSEWMDDEKVQMLPFDLQRHLVALFCLRCKRSTHEMPETQIAFRLKINETELKRCKEAFLREGFIDDDWGVLNWNKRQFVSDSSTERVRKFREKQAEKQDETLLVNETFPKRGDGTNCSVIEQNRTEQIQNIKDFIALNLPLEPLALTPAPEKPAKKVKSEDGLPEWLPIEAWTGWAENRKKNKSPVEGRSKTIALNRLTKWHEEGYDLTVILDAATFGNWQGLYLPKDEKGETIKPKPPKVEYVEVTPEIWRGKDF